MRKKQAFSRAEERGKMAGKSRHGVVIYWSKADAAYIAEVPELRGCAADGATRQEALAAAEVVIGEWIETAKELGRPIPEPHGRLMDA
jgi:predicted RNase H-like HicB family nuclease